jgi:hypothetical protein
MQQLLNSYYHLEIGIGFFEIRAKINVYCVKIGMCMNVHVYVYVYVGEN